MNLDNTKAFDVLTDERVYVNADQEAIYAMVDVAGDPVSGGAVDARQQGNQLTLRFKKVDYSDPDVHDKLRTTNYGTLRIKQRFSENDYWSCLCTGAVRARHEV
jgi:hypothetical protein